MAETSQAIPATVSTWRVLLAPWYGIVNPVAAARIISRGSRRAFAIACVIVLIVGACVIVLLEMWDASGTSRVVATPAPLNPIVAAPTGQSAANPSYSVERVEVSVGQVWADWHEYGWFGQAEYTFLEAFFGGLVAISALAWLFLPCVHRTGPIGVSFGRALRIAVAVVGLPAFTGVFLRSVHIMHESTARPWEPTPWHATRLLPLLTVLLTIVIAIRVWRTAAAKPTRPLGQTLAVIGALMLAPFAAYFAYLYYLHPEYTLIEALLDMLGILSYPGCFVVYLYCLGSVFRIVRPQHRIHTDVAPTCEGCGYDLTHQPDDQRCPECGRSIRNSLEPGVCRSDSTWERAGGIQGWIRAFLTLLFKPGRYYGSMRIRTGDEAAVTFGRWNHALLGLGGGCGALFIFTTLLPSMFRPTVEEFVEVAAAAGLGTVLVCWLGHRLGAALVVSLWMVRRSLPDYGWVRKVIEYESVFLWAFCVFWGLLLGAAALETPGTPSFLGNMIAVGPFSLPIGVVILIAGTVALSAAWYWRYQIALRAIRWNNF